MTRLIDKGQLERLPGNDRQLVLSFGATNPGIAELPHCIFSSSAACLEAVVELTAKTVGLWGVWPLVDASGEPYLAPEDGRVIEDFRLWELEDNQRLVSDYGSGHDTSFFSMAIDSRTHDDVLEKLYLMNGDADSFYYYHYICQVTSWMKWLPWAYVPLEWEGEFALFVASSDNALLVRRLVNRLATAGHEAFRVVKRGGRFCWGGPLQWLPTGT